MTDRDQSYRVIEVIGLSKLSPPLAEYIDNLAFRVERLTPHPRRPDRFHEEKSELVCELHRLARKVRYG